MTVIRPNSISGITSITGFGGDISIFRADGTTGDLIVNNVTTGIVTATSFVGGHSGDGANLTNLPAGNLTGNLPAISAANLTSIPAGNLTGTVADARISTLTASKLSGSLPAIDGSNLTGVGASFGNSSVNTSGIITATAFVQTISHPANRNLVINGGLLIAQRATSSTANGFGSVDRWQHEYGGTDEAPTFTQSDVVSSDSGDNPFAKGITKCIKITNGNQTGGFQNNRILNFNQNFEAQNVRNSGWNYNSSSSYMTLSFYAKASVSQNYHGFVKTQDGTNYLWQYETGVLTANTWTRIIKTFPGHSNLQIDNDSTGGFQVFPIFFGGSNYTDNSINHTDWQVWNSGQRSKDQTATWWTTNDATLELTGIQLEVGPVATPFEIKTYHQELRDCMRYFQKDINRRAYWGSGNVSDRQFPVHFITEMRATPTVSFHSTSLDGGSAAAYNKTKQGYNFAMTGNGRFYEWAHTANAEI